MMILSVLVVAALSIFSASASPVGSAKVIHERRTPGSSSWSKHRRLAARDTIPIRVGLKHTNTHLLAEKVASVSDPASPQYGQHWTQKQISEFFAPSDHAISEVKAWLAEEGVGAERLRTSSSKGWLTFEATAEEADRLFDTEFHVYQHLDGSEHIGCEDYSVPSHVKHHIDLITPTVNFVNKRYAGPQKRDMKKSHIFRGPKTNGKVVSQAELAALDLSTCNTMIVPDCLRALYGINRTPTQTDINTFAVVEFTPQSYIQKDLDMFFGNFSPAIKGTSPILVSIDGGLPTPAENDGFNINGESDLDFQYAMSLTAPQPVQLYQTGDAVEGASFNNYLDGIDGDFCTFDGGDDPNNDGIYPDPLPGGFEGPESCGIVSPANVISISYGAQEIEVSAAYQERECTEHGKLGLAGVTILYSSGDNGVAGNQGLCVTANGTEARNGRIFNPGFPVTCPFVTAVGATQVDPGKAVTDPEGACEQVIFSGGGFSNIFPLPDYQQAAVTSFFTNHPPPFTAAQFNNSGQTRGYPDLSANGANYLVAVDGRFSLVFGTSASAPVVASMITLINDARIEAGKGPVGFINPAIYSDAFAGAFNDITHGGNQGCGTAGFTAVEGWDPVTGLGTPNFPNLLEAFLALP